MSIEIPNQSNNAFNSLLSQKQIIPNQTTQANPSNITTTANTVNVPTNSVNTVTVPSSSAGAPANPITIVLPDTFQKEKTAEEKPTKNFLTKYSGVVALAVSVIGLPIVYFAAKKSGKKSSESFTEMKNSIDALTKQVADLKKLEGKVEETAKKKSNYGTLVATLLGVGGGTAGVLTAVNNKKSDLKQQGYSDEDINDAQSLATSIASQTDNIEQKARNAENNANDAKGIANDARNTVGSFDHRINEANERAREAWNDATGVNPIMKAYTVRHFDLNLLQIKNFNESINKLRTSEVMEAVKKASPIRLKRSASDTRKTIKDYKDKFKKLTSTWSLTAEYVPIKAGGLGVVPMELQDNFEQLGIETATFIPMYLQKNKSEFLEMPGGKYSYTYGANKFDLVKIAEAPTHVYRNGHSSVEKIEYYMAELPVSDSDKKKQLIFIKNDNYFNNNIYDSTTGAEETEKFALFTKAVYQLAKLKVNHALGVRSGITDLKITDPDSFNKLKAPNSMILNDWHAGSMASLLRYRAPMEYNYNELEKTSYEALKDMPTILIGHNMGIQGQSNSGSGSLLAKNNNTENVINTLFDGYAIGITENADSGIILNDNDDLCNTVLLKRKTADKQFNNLFIGVALSDWFVPVSENYTNEVINDYMKSGILYELLQARKDTGTISGTINGLDKKLNDMKAVENPKINPYRIPGLNLEIYDENIKISEIMSKRKENKQRFYDIFIQPKLDPGYKGQPEIVNPSVPFSVSKDDFVDSPVISFAHRLAGQKGLEIMKGAIFKLFDNWETGEFKDQKMPVFIVGGAVQEDGQEGHLDALKNPDYGTNKERLNRVLVLKGNMPNYAVMAASTYFCAPSTYEPCGLTQGEAFAKGTPIIATYTGGFVDTVYDPKVSPKDFKYKNDKTIGQTGFLAPEINEDSFYEAMVRSLKLYYDEPKKYAQMVKNDLKVDLSWMLSNKEGPIFEYADKLGLDKADLPDTIQIAQETADRTAKALEIARKKSEKMEREADKVYEKAIKISKLARETKNEVYEDRFTAIKLNYKDIKKKVTTAAQEVKNAEELSEKMQTILDAVKKDAAKNKKEGSL